MTIRSVLDTFSLSFYLNDLSLQFENTTTLTATLTADSKL